MNISQFIPTFKSNKNLGKDKSVNSLLDKALIETFRHRVRIWYDFLYEAILVLRADFGPWTKRWKSTVPALRRPRYQLSTSLLYFCWGLQSLLFIGRRSLPPRNYLSNSGSGGREELFSRFINQWRRMSRHFWRLVCGLRGNIGAISRGWKIKPTLNSLRSCRLRPYRNAPFTFLFLGSAKPIGPL